MNSLSYSNYNGLIGFGLDSALTNVVESHSSSDQAICVNVLFMYPDTYWVANLCTLVVNYPFLDELMNSSPGWEQKYHEMWSAIK